MPLLENLGFRVVNERTYRVASVGASGMDRVWLHDMTLERASGGPIDIDAIQDLIEAALLALFRGLAESDALQPSRARSRPWLARRRDGARARPLPAPDAHSLRAGLSRRDAGAAQRDRRQSWSSCSMPASIRASRTDRARTRGGDDPRPRSRSCCATSRASTTIASCAASSTSSKRRSAPTISSSRITACRARPSRSSSNARRSMGLPLPQAALRDLPLFAARRRRAYALRQGGARRSSLVRSAAGFPHRGAGPRQGAAGQERRHRAGRCQGRLRAQAPAAGERSAGLACGGHREPTASSSARCCS